MNVCSWLIYLKEVHHRSRGDFLKTLTFFGRGHQEVLGVGTHAGLWKPVQLLEATTRQLELSAIHSLGLPSSLRHLELRKDPRSHQVDGCWRYSDQIWIFSNFSEERMRFRFLHLDKDNNMIEKQRGVAWFPNLDIDVVKGPSELIAWTAWIARMWLWDL